MTITQTIEIPADRRITLEVPCEIRSESVVLSFAPAHAAKPFKESETRETPSGGKIRLSRSVKNALLQDETLLSLTGILHSDMSVDEIRDERLAKHLK